MFLFKNIRYFPAELIYCKLLNKIISFSNLNETFLRWHLKIVFEHFHHLDISSIQFEIFLILGMMSDFYLIPGHFGIMF